MRRAFSHRRPTIGVLIRPCKRSRDIPLYNGLIDGALKHDVNLLFFQNDRTETYRYLQTLLYPLVSSERVDGWVVVTEQMAIGAADRDIKALKPWIPEKPIICIGSSESGIPQIIADGYCSMRDLLIDLWKEHGCDTIGVIQSIDQHPVCSEFERAYRDVFKAFGIGSKTPEPIYAEMSEAGGRMAVLRLEAEGRLRHIKAIIAACPRISRGVCQGLEAMGYRVPTDMMVVGVDDGDGDLNDIPSMTQITPDLYSMGEAAIKSLIDMGDGVYVPSVHRIPFLQRNGEFCGWIANHIDSDGASRGELQDKSADETFLMEHMARALKMASEKRRSYETLKRILKGLSANLFDEEPSEAFLNLFECQLDFEREHGLNLKPWHRVMTIIDQWYRAVISDPKVLKRLDVLIQSTRMMISAGMEQQERAKQVALEKAIERMPGFFASILACRGIDRLQTVIRAEMMRLGIEDCTVALFDTPLIGKASTEAAGLSEEYRSSNALIHLSSMKGEGIHLPLRNPTSKIPLPKQRYTRVVQALIYDGIYYGYFVTGMGHDPSPIADAVRDGLVQAIGSVLCGERYRKQVIKPKHGWAQAAQGAI